MRLFKQIDCFEVNMKIWKVLGIWHSSDMHPYYRYYQYFFLTFMLSNNLFVTINFFFLPRQLDMFIEELMFYFTELAVTSKALTFFFMHEKIVKILNMLESNIFQPKTESSLKVIDEAKKFNVRYFKMVAAVAATSHISHILSPLLAHFIFHTKLNLPVCRISYLSEDTIQRFIYPLYVYQTIGMQTQVLYNTSIDTFILGLLIFAIAQLDILDHNLRRVTDKKQTSDTKDSSLTTLNDSVIHYYELGKYCELIRDVFSVSLFVQFSVSSCIICVVLFRFTLPATWQYFIFLGSYMFIMVIQILVPCWFGTHIQDKSQLLAHAVYNCDWTTKSRCFNNNLRLFVERANKPLSITAGKMFSLSLTTFTSIMNSSYSFFTLLSHMQTRET